MKTIVRICVRLSCLFGLVGLASCVFQRETPGDPQAELAARVQRRRELAVLFVGNSYSFGIPREFAKVAAEHGKTVRTGHSTYGGWSLARHAKHEPTLRKIRDGGWDLVVLQEFSKSPALPPRRRAARMMSPLRALVAEVRKAGAQPVLYQTWGRQDGSPELRGDDFLAMNQRVRDGYRAASAALGGVVVIPAGDAWEREISAGRGAGLFQEDGSHPSKFGDRVTAEAFYRTIFASPENDEGERGALLRKMGSNG